MLNWVHFAAADNAAVWRIRIQLLRCSL